MKKSLLIIALAMATSTAALADDCANILGNFTCSVQGQQIPLSISRTQANALKVSVNGEDGILITDGNIQESGSDDSPYIATCSKDLGLNVVNTFKETTQSVSIKPSKKGVTYEVDRGESKLSFECAK